ncbi:DUF2306 domain-containing protein [Novosphingobium sp. 9]|uniref:DUF2306 domain-containing protein n=1 Tax=Novosphingobium sp. 9 TaxID=2025349 RepID=UPI0021B6027D|nr:hypothetical protein [Novosphingobium sp. 9]
MSTLPVDTVSPTPLRSTVPDRLERALGVLSLAMLVVVAVAVAKGAPQWSLIPRLVWAHLGTICLALGLTPVLMWQRRGTRLHRRLGYVWCAAMFGTALVSLFVHGANSRFSLIHILSVLVIVLVPSLILAARSHNVARHRRTVRGLIIGALLVAGFFTFPFHRLLGMWLFG